MSSEVSNLARELRKEIRELKSSLEFINKQYETLKQDCADVRTENVALKASQHMLTQEIETLKKQLHETSLKVTSQDQYSRNKNIEIKGIPHERTEKLVDVLGKVGDALGEPIKEQDIEVCHRVATRKAATEQSIVVVFNQRAKREKVLEKARKARINSNDLGFDKSQAIYINEHLCPQLKRLLGLAIVKKKELNWRFVWVKGGKIFARKTETSNAVRIGCEADIEKMRD
ncbi:hypothetical protein HPB50_015251 [Hyalomma asiaticum]|uniref:Uncharacterized protein n=1 Tax=Hyalomma asiaticum TaxID=266040 RepID=A0ACB7TL09_HYAAI|nr:hypothetical protein HPB50_015251 [Hyalomma asiaticum]